MSYYSIKQEEWDNKFEQLILSHNIFATVSNEFGQDYELLKASEIPHISYNRRKPSTPLTSYFNPVTENITSVITAEKSGIITGIPGCDIEELYNINSMTNII